MRCINNLPYKVLSAMMAFVIVTCTAGCAEQEIPFAYDADNEVSSFRVITENNSVTADAFAANLCVTVGDINVNDAVVDMSEATSAGLFDLSNGEVMYAKNIHERLAPASLTKLMTAIVALKYGNKDDMITCGASVNITEDGAVVCGLKEGDQLTLNQALHALLIKSANDAANAIAEHIGGSVERFCEMMNEEAALIGATNSHFTNPNGLTADNHYSTAYDMYLIFNEAIKYEAISEIIQMTNYESVYTDKAGNAKQLSFSTSNQYFKGNAKAPEKVTVIGGKTGTTTAARNCLVLLAKDAPGNPYIAVIMRSSERGILYTEMTDLLEEID